MRYKKQVWASDLVSCYYSVLRWNMNEFQSTQLLNSSLPRRTYLVTYSQANLTKFPTRKEFGKCIKKHFNSGSGKVKVQHWACAKEKHENGGGGGGVHYHVALKLTGPKRWKSVKESISSKEEIVVNFSDNHDNYYSAYRYICKDDDSVHHSKHHPNLDDVVSPRTKKSTQAYRQARKSYAQENPTDAPQKKSRKQLQETSNSIRRQCVFIKKQYTLWHRAFLWSKQKKGGRTDRFGSLCVVQVK